MNRKAALNFAILLSASALSLWLTACGGGGSTPITVPPTSGYSLTAGTLSPGSVAAGSSATSTITVTPANGYQGNVTLSCSITGGSTPAPTCAFDNSTVAITAGAGTSKLTISTTSATPSAAYAISVTGKDASSTAPSNGAQALSVTVKFQHIVIIFQENRTPDNLFHDTTLITRGADIASSGVNSLGQTIQLVSTTLGQDYDQSHQHDAFTAMCDYDSSTKTCKMDGADLIKITCSKGATNCPPANPNFMYVQQSDVQPYFDMAEQYTFGDHMFQTNQGPSFPAHQFLISGTSEPVPGSSLFVAENPLGVANSSADAGCTAPSTEYVSVIDASGSETSNPTIYPCFEHATLTDELNAAGVTWRYYAPLAGSIWTAPNAIQHMCAAPGSTACTAPDWVNNVSLQTQQDMAPVLTEIAAGQLRQVNWVIPNGVNSDHSGSPTTTGGPSWVASIVNAIGQSAYWSNTAIIITWDDWGGWYDHVPPPKVINDGSSWGSGYVYGFRVPLIVVSPLAKPKYISKTPHDFGSILKFIENTFDVPALDFADANALDDFSDCFDFTQTPLTFKPIHAPLKADFFLHDNRPPTGPDDD